MSLGTKVDTWNFSPSISTSIWVESNLKLFGDCCQEDVNKKEKCTELNYMKDICFLIVLAMLIQCRFVVY